MEAESCKYPGSRRKKQQKKEGGGGFVVVAPVNLAMIHYHAILRSRERETSHNDGCFSAFTMMATQYPINRNWEK